MPPTRKRAEPDKNENENQIPTYSSEVAWLACLTDPSKDFDANEEIANGEINNALITEACKLSYILYHNIQAQDCLPKILQSLNKSGTEDETELTRVAKSKQSAWKAHVLNKFLLPHVKEIVRKWCVARPYASFGSLPASDRNKLWLEAYDASPKGTVISMWKPVIGVLDLGLIFRTDLPDEHNTNMAAVRQMLQQKYCFGCECTYKYSVADTKKWKTLEHWASYAKISDFASSIVPFADLPISAKILAIASSGRLAKKAKVALAETDFETASVSSTFDRSDAANVASDTPECTSGERHNPEDISKFLSSLANFRTTPMAPSLSALEKHEEFSESSPALQHLMNHSSPDVGLTRQGGQESSGISDFFAKDNLPLFRPAPKLTPPPAALITEEERRFNEFFGIPDQTSLSSPKPAEADPSIAGAAEVALDDDLL